MKRKILVFVVLLTVCLGSAFSMIVLAAAQTESDVQYYDKDGNRIVMDGLYYDENGIPCFNASCYYLDDEDNPVYVGGCRVYCYDENGVLMPYRYYVDADGNPVNPPDSYRSGCGYGTWRYGADGGRLERPFYYDEDGNEGTPPERSVPGYGRDDGCCGGRGRGGRWN